MFPLASEWTKTEVRYQLKPSPQLHLVCCYTLVRSVLQLAQKKPHSLDETHLSHALPDVQDLFAVKSL
jgi:hypothetical protein